MESPTPVSTSQFTESDNGVSYSEASVQRLWNFSKWFFSR